MSEVIQSARLYISDGSPERIKVLLRDLVECIEVSGEEVTLSYGFKSPGAKVAHQNP